MRTGFLLAALLACSAARGQFVTPGTNLVADGIPPVPRAVAERVHAYSEFWPQRALAWHPEKREMLISRRAGDASQVFRLDSPGAKPEQYTSFADPVSRASYPRRGAGHFVFVKDEGGNERYQLWRYDVQTRNTARLTDPSKRHSSPVWALDGRVAYTAVAVGAQRDSSEVRVEIRVMDPRDPATDRLVAALPGPGWFLLDWSEDGKTLALGEYVSAVESYLWLVDAQSGEKRALTPDRSVRVAYSGGAFSPDGRTLYTTSDRDGEFRRLVAIDVAKRDTRLLSGDRPWDVESFDLTTDGTKLAFTTNEDGESRLNLIEPVSGRALSVPPLPKGVISGLAWNRQGTELAFNFSSAKEPAGAYSLELAGARIVRWTVADTAGADPAKFVEPELVRWKSFDGRTISGYLYRPPQERFSGRRPVVVEIHGGPEGQSRPGFYGRYNYFINELGIALLLPNVRGSTGYGKTFVGLDDGMKREDSVRDIGAALDWIGSDPRLDAQRVLVSGGSYGGYMSLATATLYPERVACTIDVVGISNFVSFLTNTESYRRDLRRVEYGDERDPAMRAHLEKISPLNRAERIKKPLLVIQGANDPRVPRTEAEQIVRTVRGHGTSVWYLLAMDEGHGFAKKSNADFAFYTRVMFAEQCLK